MLPAMAESGEPATRILDATVRLMVRHGSAKVAMVDVCREAEVSRATLYRCFATREKLFAALTARMGSHFRTVMTRAVEADPRVDRRFRVVVQAVNSFVNGSHQHLGALRQSEPEFVLSQFRDRWPEFVGPIRDAIVDAFPPGTTRRHRVVLDGVRSADAADRVGRGRARRSASRLCPLDGTLSARTRAPKGGTSSLELS
jgi:AcrR family transcriptional regulator